MQFAIFIMLSVLLLARGFISPKSTPCRINTLGGREITAFTSSQRFNNSPLFTRRKLLPNSTASRYLSSKRHISSKNNESEVYTKLGNCKSIAETLRAGVQRLEEYSAPEPTASACHLLSFALKDDFRWEDNGFSTLLNILDNPRYDKNLSEKEMKIDELDCFSKMLERRIAKEPLQYIIGQWDFHDCVLKIRPPCLCPRPETEELVEYAANDIKRMIQLLRANGSDRKLRILNVGCGTGAIGIAVANLFKNDVEVVAIDVAKAAIGLSEENARFVLGDKQSCHHKPILCPATEYTGENKVFVNHTFQYDIVISNPPYIPSKDMDTLTSDVVDYEDYGALCGGDDGLDVVRDILKRLPEWCDVRKDPHLFNPICWMEVDTSHPILIEKSAGQHESIEFLQGLKDFGGLDRFVQLEIKLKNN